MFGVINAKNHQVLSKHSTDHQNEEQTYESNTNERVKKEKKNEQQLKIIGIRINKR